MLVEYAGHPRTVLRVVNDFGFKSLDLVALPRRLGGHGAELPLVETVDQRRVRPLPLPSSLLGRLPEGENWTSTTDRTLARLYAAFLFAEDPQRRLETRKAATLMHQVSLVQHILERPELRRVLIGDEVGLGKTIEAGLLIRQFIDRNPLVRVLYLAPARLVPNVARELNERLEINARRWVAGPSGDARLEDDKVVVASIHKAVFGDNLDSVVTSGPWDIIIVDECHHLSDWDPDGGSPNRSFRLVSQLRAAQPADGRLILMSGTPHQGNEARFVNILRLLSDNGKDVTGATGKVIFRTKDRVKDWIGAPLFPSRDIRQPTVVQLGNPYTEWYLAIGALYDGHGPARANARATGWAKGQALQWAASSVQAGLGFLVRLAMRRLAWTPEWASLGSALAALRPYRSGPRDEPILKLFARIQKQIGNRAQESVDLEDDEEFEIEQWQPNPGALSSLLEKGVQLLEDGAGEAKWDAVCRLVDEAGGEKIVLFAQPVETVTVVADLLESRYGVRPAIIIGNQTESERLAQVDAFISDDGPRFLVSSRAGGEGLNMQRARRLIHLDVPWNPMELEQRIGRIHRFGSRKTVIIDTVVAAGSREVDMYRIAREKLALVARQLDPDQFETLFSRVMSLVPPKELETLLTDITGTMGLDDRATNEIGRLVTEGYRSWNSFDEKYRRQAEAIRSIEPGEARWSDLADFLVRHGGAEVFAGATYTAFKALQDEIVPVEQTVAALRIEGLTYACGDTGGLSAVLPNGEPIPSLGLNLEPVQRTLRTCFAPDMVAGVAAIRRPEGLDFLGLGPAPLVVLALIRQALRQERGLYTEQAVTLHLYATRGQEGDTQELDGVQRAAFVRQCCRGPRRVQNPQVVELAPHLSELEEELIDGLRRPTDQEMESGIRYAVWPLAVICLVPAA